MGVLGGLEGERVGPPHFKLVLVLRAQVNQPVETMPPRC